MYKPNQGRPSDVTLGSADCISRQSSTGVLQGCDTLIQQNKAIATPARASAQLSTIALTMAAVAALGGAVPDASAQAAAQAGAARNAATSFEGQAAQLGIKSCAGVFGELGKTVAEGATYASSAHTLGDPSQDHAAQAIVGLKYDAPDYKAQAAGIVFAAPTQSGCEGQVVRVAPFQESCPDVARRLPTGSTLATTLSGSPLYTLGGNRGQALLVSSGASCVVVTVASAMDRR